MCPSMSALWFFMNPSFEFRPHFLKRRRKKKTNKREKPLDSALRFLRMGVGHHQAGPANKVMLCVIANLPPHYCLLGYGQIKKGPCPVL